MALGFSPVFSMVLANYPLHPLFPLFLLETGLHVIPAPLMLHFPQELPVTFQPRGIESSVVHSLPHGTSWLLIVVAVPELAVLCQFFNVTECFVYSFFHLPELELAHTGSVDEIGAGGKSNELSMRGCVAPPAVVFSYFNGLEFFTTQEAVDER